MDFTRKNKILRIKIGCVDPSLIPPSSDVFIRRGFFKLDFKIEPEVFPQGGILFGNVDNGNDDGGGSDDHMEEANTDNATDMDMETSVKNDDGNTGGTASRSVGTGGQGCAPIMQSTVELHFGAFVSHIPWSGNVSLSVPCALVESLPATTSDHLLYTELYDQPVAAMSGGLPSVQATDDYLVAAPVHEQMKQVDTSLEAARVPEGVVGSGAAFDGQGTKSAMLASSPQSFVSGHGEQAGTAASACGGWEPKGSLLALSSPQQRIAGLGVHAGAAAGTCVWDRKGTSTEVVSHVHSGMSTMLESTDAINHVNVLNSSHNSIPGSSSDHPSLDDVIAFGGIACADESAVRSSARIARQADADTPQLDRAMRNAQLRNDYTAGISPPKHSILSFSDDLIIDRAKRLGVSLGSNQII
jgi:hypothetical protein